MSLDRLATAAKEGVFAAGGFPMEFGTISVSDGISMGHEGMHFSLVSREIIADSVEAVVQAERLDGIVTFAGCDKSLPGMLMASARLDIASVFVYAGSILPGHVKLSDGTEKDVTIIDAFEAVGACARGLMSREDVDRIERGSARSTIASGWIPMLRSDATECWVGLVFNSPDGPMYGSRDTCKKKTLSRARCSCQQRPRPSPWGCSRCTRFRTPRSPEPRSSFAILALLVPAVVFLARTRSAIAALVLAGFVGLIIAVWLLLLGAPDVALTLLLVEFLTVVVAAPLDFTPEGNNVQRLVTEVLRRHTHAGLGALIVSRRAGDRRGDRWLQILCVSCLDANLSGRGNICIRRRADSHLRSQRILRVTSTGRMGYIFLKRSASTPCLRICLKRGQVRTND